MQLLASGDTLTGAVSATTPAVFRTAVKAGNQLAIYLDAGPNVIMTVLSTSGTVLTTWRGSGDLSGATTLPFVLPSASDDALYDLEIAVAPNDTQEESFRLRATTVDPRPEHTQAAMTLGTVVQDAIDDPADIDEYTFNATAGQLVELYVQQLDTGVPGGVIVGVVPDATLSCCGGGATSTPPDSDLESKASGLITLPTTGRYRVSARALARNGTPTYVGGYRFEVFAIDSLPEHASATLTAGDTVANESIDHVGDIDVFTLAGTPGAEYNVFLEASGILPHRVTAEVPGRYELATTAAPGTPLLQNASGRFTMPPSGSMTIRVHDANTANGVYRGPYRLFAARIDHAPEGIAPAITPGAPIMSALEVPGDIDEYSLTLSTPTTLNLMVTRGADAIGSTLQVQFGGTGAQYDPVYYVPSSTTSVSSGHLDLAPGTYKFTASGTSSRGDGYRGSYQLELRPVNPAPESVPARIAVGDTVRGEALEYAGDVDTFALPIVAGDTVNITLATPGQPNPGLYFYLQDATTHVRVGWGSSQSGRLEPDPGTYQLVVGSQGGGEVPSEKGPYELAIDRVSARPEHHTATIALGDTVRDEPIDYPGDYDDFLVHGQPGQEIYATFTWVPDGSMGPYLNGAGSLAILDSASGVILGGTPSYGGAGMSGRVAIPASGVVRVRVQGLSESFTGGFTGGYWFVVVPINRAPETRGTAFALGDTVADAIQPSVDIDEFTFNSVAGQSIDIFFQAPNGLASPSFSGLQLDLIDQTTGALVATMLVHNYTPNLEDINLRGVVLPSSGSYLVRVQSMPDLYGYGNYRFRIAASQ